MENILIPLPLILSPLQLAPTADYEVYYITIFIVFTFLIYWYIIRSGFVIHIMQPLGNVGKESQTIESIKDILNSSGDKIGEEKSTKILSGNAGIYQEIAKKKVGFSNAGKTVNFFASKKELKIGNNMNATGKSYVVDPLGVSYIHWRNRHIYLDSESMIPMKLQSGQFNPSSRLWYQLFELGLLIGLHKGASTAPVKTKNSNLTLILIFAAAMAIGYFIGILYGGQLSPALVHPITSTTITSLSHSMTTSFNRFNKFNLNRNRRCSINDTTKHIL